MEPIPDFSVQDSTGRSFHVSCATHNGNSWRLLIFSSAEIEVGDLVFMDESAVAIRLFEFNIIPEFTQRGAGTKILLKLISIFRERGVKTLSGICKSYDRPPEEKEKLAQLYIRLGFTLLREDRPDIPGYVGIIRMDL